MTLRLGDAPVKRPASTLSMGNDDLERKHFANETFAPPKRAINASRRVTFGHLQRGGLFEKGNDREEHGKE